MRPWIPMTMATLVMWLVFLALLVRRCGTHGLEAHTIVVVYALTISEVVFYLFAAARALGFVITAYPILSTISSFRSMARVLIFIVALLTHTRRRIKRGSR